MRNSMQSCLTDGSLSSLDAFVQEHRSSDLSAQVVNPTQPDQIQQMTKDLFGSMSIDVSEAQRNSRADDIFLLMDDGTVIASTPMSTLRDTLLMVNTDLHRTGTHSLEDITASDVLLELSDTVFELDGYPNSNTEKLVLALMSRYIERQAWRHKAGVVRASFQELSRLYSENGTRRVYERLGALPELDVHAYGAPDQEQPPELPVAIHGLYDEELLRSWFVVYRSEAGNSVALVALERGPNEWDGLWTFNSNKIEAINEYITQSF